MGVLGLSLAEDHVMSAIEWDRNMAKDMAVKAQSQVRLDIRAHTEKGLNKGGWKKAWNKTEANYKRL